MKIQGSKKVHYDSGPNMTPLVDVVMVILIFLMLAGSFGAMSHFLPSTMPIRQGGKGDLKKEIAKLQDPQLEIFVSSAGPDAFKARIGTNQTVYTDVESLKKELTSKRVAHENAGNSKEKMQIVICPDLFCRYEHIIWVYEAAMGAEWPKIGFMSARR